MPPGRLGVNDKAVLQSEAQEIVGAVVRAAGQVGEVGCDRGKAALVFAEEVGAGIAERALAQVGIVMLHRARRSIARA